MSKNSEVEALRMTLQGVMDERAELKAEVQRLRELCWRASKMLARPGYRDGLAGLSELAAELEAAAWKWEK